MRVSEALAATSETLPGIGHNKAPISEVFREKYEPLIAEVEDAAAKATKAKNDLVDARINTDDERDTFIGIGTLANKILAKIEKSRAGEVEPLNEQVKEWNGLFGTKTPAPGSLAARMANVKAFAGRAIDDYAARKLEAERRRLAEEARKAREEEQRKLDEATKAAPDSVHADIALNEAAAADHRAAALEQQAVTTAAASVRTDAGSAVATGKWTFRVVDRSKIDLNQVPFSLAEIEAALGRHAREHHDSKPIAGVQFYREAKTQFRA